MHELLIHIGYHKTASTWLQRSLFNKPESGFTTPWRRDKIVEDWVRFEPLSFDASAMQADCQPVVEKAWQQNLIPVISQERLSGYPASGGYDSTLIADRLAAVFPNAKILIVIREQKSLIRSWYAQYVFDGGSLPLRRYLYPPETSYMARIPLFRPEFYQFDRLIQYYRKLFLDNVLVLPFELLKIDPQEFIERICSFVGLPKFHLIGTEKKNIGKSTTWVNIARMSNRLFLVNQLSPDALINRPHWSKQIRKAADTVDQYIPQSFNNYLNQRQQRLLDRFIKSRYQASNRITSNLIEIELSDYGYDCAPLI